MSTRFARTLGVLVLAASLGGWLSPARADEPTLQPIFDDTLGPGCVDASMDTGAETFAAGTYQFTLLARYSADPDQLGWYPLGSPSEFHPIFSATDTAGSVQPVTIGVAFGLMMRGYYDWFSEVEGNVDAFDHFATFSRCGPPGGVAVGVEDTYGGGDADYNDLVLTFQPANDRVVGFEYTNKDDAGFSILGPGAARGIKGTVFPIPTGLLAARNSTLSEDDLEIEVLTPPPGCGTPTITVDGFNFQIEWPDDCFDFGEKIEVCFRTAKGPIGIDHAAIIGAEGDSIAKAKADEGPPVPVCEDMGGPVPVQVALASAGFTPRGVRLEWYSSDAAHLDAFVQRRTASTGWLRVGRADVTGSDRLVFEDRAVVPGERYGYRLGFRDEDGEAFGPETWIDVPLVGSLALAPPRPNPASRDLVVECSLASSAPARIELIDVNGRRVRSEALPAAPGRHRVELSGISSLAPGVYVVRLVQGAATRTARVSVLP